MERKRPKTYDELRFTDDFMFCKIMTNNPDICEEFVSLMIGKSVKIKMIEKQAPMEITSDGRGIRLDVYAEDDESVIYDIEMQNTNARNLPKRARYYQGMMDLNLLERGAGFNELKQDYIIFICPFDPVGRDLYRYTFKTVCIEDTNIVLDDDSTKIFINGTASAADASPKMKAMLDYIMNKGAKDGFTRKIDGAVKQAVRNEEWGVEYMLLIERDRENWEAGKAEGLAKGKGLGIEENRKETAIRMIAENEPVEKISRYTGLRVEQIKEIQKSQKRDIQG